MALWLIGVRVFKIPWLVCFDDFVMVMLRRLSSTSLRAALFMLKALGWRYSEAKVQPPSLEFIALGVLFDVRGLCEGVLKVGNKPGRLEGILEALRACLRKRRHVAGRGGLPAGAVVVCRGSRLWPLLEGGSQGHRRQSDKRRA